MKKNTTPKQPKVRTEKQKQRKRIRDRRLRILGVIVISAGLSYGGMKSLNWAQDENHVTLPELVMKSDMFTVLEPPSTLRSHISDVIAQAKGKTVVAPHSVLPRSLERGMASKSPASPETIFTEMKELKAKARQGNPHAQLLLADLHFNGTDVKQDLFLAYHWYKKAVEGFVAKDDEQLVRLVEHRLDALMHDIPDTINPNYIIWDTPRKA